MTLKRRIDVMVSSTTADLGEARQRVAEVVTKHLYVPRIMDNDSTTGKDGVTYSLDLVDEAEIYILLLGFRYGYIPDDPRNPDKISMTHMEFRRAKERAAKGEVIVLPFLVHDKHRPEKLADGLEAFRKEVLDYQVKFFDNDKIEELALAVSQALNSENVQKHLNALHPNEDKPFTLKEGEILAERYHLQRSLGIGGNGEVWLASEPKPDGSSQRLVALKLLKAVVSADQRRIARFKSEVSKAVDLKHQHIARALTYGEVAGQFYAVMDYIEGESLQDFIADKQFSELETANYLEQIAHALDYAHSLHIVHRDVKPANILVSWAEGNRLYLSDFGLAVSDEEENSLTETGELVGTKRYMAPEQWRGEDCSSVTDVYALGIIAYEMLTGQVPFEAKTHLLLGQKHLNEALPEHPTLKEEVLAILRRACAKNPKERYASASDFVHALRHWQMGEENLSARLNQHASKIRATINRDVYEKFVDLSGDRHSLQVLLKAQKEGGDNFARGFIDYDALLLNTTQAQVEAYHESAERGERHSVEDVREKLLQLNRAVLVGEPGAGKTWMTWRLTLEYLDILQDKRPNPHAQKRIPVFVPLNLFKGQNAEGEKQSFDDFVRQWMPNIAPYHDELLKQGRLVILCDALNEMARQAADGRELLPELIDYLRDCPAFVVSCRVRDYKDDLQDLRPLEQVILRELELPAIEQLIKRRLPELEGTTLWQNLGGSSELYSLWQKTKKRGESAIFWEHRSWHFSYSTSSENSAWDTMHKDPRRLMLLCRNPFIASMVCSVYINGKGQLPNNRVELFRQFIETLLKREQEIITKRRGQKFPEFSAIEEALVNFAAVLQRGRETTLPKVEVLSHPHFMQAEDALQAAIDASLLVDDGQNWKFSHQLIQEYFALRILLEDLLDDEKMGTNKSGTYLGAKWWEAGVWRETLIMLGEFLGEYGANRVAKWIAPVSPELALEIKSRLYEEDSPLGDWLNTVEELVKSAKAKCDEPNPVGRAAAYRVLGYFNADERAGVGLFHEILPNIEWGGEVIKGTYKLGHERTYKPFHIEEVSLNYNYRLAKFPVTVMQFGIFIKAGGIESDDWWGDFPNKFKKQEVTHWNDTYSNHPVENVSWYQAVAFCRWLTHHCHMLYLLDKDWEIRLPTEQEWEIAARYPNGQHYPWGSEIATDKMNVSETGINRTSAVGIFQSGRNEALELYDMAGNVWEWCRTEFYSGSNEIDETKAKDPEQYDIRRVLRGGSCFNYAHHARTTARIGHIPSFMGSNETYREKTLSGFRVCTAPIGVLEE